MAARLALSEGTSCSCSMIKVRDMTNAIIQ